MGDIILLFFVQNIFIFSLIFWFLTWASEHFYKKKVQTSSKQFYECGFKSISDLNLQINLNFAIICVFLVLYDVEFIFLIPIFFNIGVLSLFQFFILMFFFTLIILSLVYDWQNQALNWQY